MPILDVMPVSTWRDLRTVMVKTKTPSDETIAEKLVTTRNIKSAQSFVHLRGAVEFLFKNVELPHNRVVFPKFICGSVIRAAQRAGMRVTLCDIDMKTGALSPEALMNIPLEKFGAVFVVHPFGIPAQMRKIADICERKNVFLIEDCAHVFDQIVDGKPVGTWGDFALFHFAKKIANVHGGILISYRTKLPNKDIKTARVSIGELVSLALKLSLFRLPLNLFRSITPLPIDNDKGNDKHYAREKAASGSAKRLFVKKLKEFRRKKHLRSEIIKLYLELLPPEYTSLLKNVPADSFHFPILVPKDKKRDVILKKLRIYNIYGDRVWYSVDHRFAKRILLLPVKEGMREKHVKMICNLLKNV